MAVATLGLASKVCGSVLGLLSTAVAWTYLPPIWLITLAYWFSAPTAPITFALSPAVAWVGPGVHALTSKAAAAAASPTAAAPSGPPALARRGGIRQVPFSVVLHEAPGPARLVTNENHNQYGWRRQAGPAPGQPVAQRPVEHGARGRVVIGIRDVFPVGPPAGRHLLA